VYEKKETVTKNVITTPAMRQQQDATGQVIGEVQDPDVIRKEEYMSTKEKKVTLMTYGDTSDEDIESFFDSFDGMKSELKLKWEEASQAKANSAAILFKAMDRMLTDTAETEWRDIIEETIDEKGTKLYAKNTWEDFKKAVLKYITTKVLPENACDKQRTYLQERVKP
jgi:hypothetical protein